MQALPWATTLVGMTPRLTPSGAGEERNAMERVMGLIQLQEGLAESTVGGRIRISLHEDTSEVTAGRENCRTMVMKSAE